MDFNATIDIILKDLSEVREIVDDLKNYPGIPRLQIELAKSKCKSAEEIIALLKTLKHVEAKEKVEAQKTVETEKRAEEPAVEDPVINHTEDLIEISNDNQDLEVSVNVPAEVKDKKSDPAIIADKFTGMPNTIQDQFGNIKKQDDIASVIKTKPVDNLSDAIGVNDKFLFIREIFSGSQPAYEEAISKLNKTESFPDARAIIMSYSGEGEENEVVKLLLEIVKRKLPADG